MTDLADLTPHERRLWLDGYAWGLVDGHDRGWAECDDEIAALQRTAARVVHAHARLDAPRPPKLQYEPAPWPDETAPIHPRALEVHLTPAEAAWETAS
jgi:hypothetical protein